jgi:predicted DNA-binding protein (UPF0251 family)
MRSSGRRGRLEHVQDITILEETVAAPRHSPEALIGLTDALCSLPERQREAILLREWQGLSYREVGSRLGLSQAAVETLIFRARRALAAALDNPGKRPRRTALRALDVGGLAAAIKGLFSGSAGVKVAALTAAVATTATVVATDPAGVWRDRPDPGSARATVAAQERLPTADASASPPTVAPIAAPAETEPRPAVDPASTQSGPNAERGREFGQATAAAAKAKNDDKSHGSNGKGKALGHTKERGSSAGSNGHSRPARVTLSSQGQGGPPAHAPAHGRAKKSS